MDKNRIEGAADQAKGKIKEGVGKLTGDSKLEAEGKSDKASGKLQNALGGLKDRVPQNESWSPSEYGGITRSAKLIGDSDVGIIPAAGAARGPRNGTPAAAPVAASPGRFQSFRWGV